MKQGKDQIPIISLIVVTLLAGFRCGSVSTPSDEEAASSAEEASTEEKDPTASTLTLQLGGLINEKQAADLGVQQITLDVSSVTIAYSDTTTQGLQGLTAETRNETDTGSQEIINFSPPKGVILWENGAKLSATPLEIQVDDTEAEIVDFTYSGMRLSGTAIDSKNGGISIPYNFDQVTTLPTEVKSSGSSTLPERLVSLDISPLTDKLKESINNTVSRLESNLYVELPGFTVAGNLEEIKSKYRTTTTSSGASESVTTKESFDRAVSAMRESHATLRRLVSTKRTLAVEEKYRAWPRDSRGRRLTYSSPVVTAASDKGTNKIDTATSSAEATLAKLEEALNKASLTSGDFKTALSSLRPLETAASSSLDGIDASGVQARQILEEVFKNL